MNDDDVAENVTDTAPQPEPAPEAQAAAEQDAPEQETPSDVEQPAPADVTPPHPAHAIIDEISSNLSVQYKPSWIREKLEQVRALL